uniref:F-box only protein 48 n=1 Tax=Lygus hesperus TaxID=30085 RepID=A0A0A9WP79_LYGHE
MEFLPPELVGRIFSFLDMRDLCAVRAVCRTWWEIANHDRFWRPLVTERGISERLLSGTNDNSHAILKNCKWANICFSYYQRVLTNWVQQRCKITRAPDSTDTTEIHLPYMVRVFEPPDHHFVEILELKGGDFVPLDKIRLPSDPMNDVSYDLTMNKNNVFVVYEWNKSIIFKLVDGSFRFDRALFFTDTGKFISCSKESDVDACIRLYSSMEQIFPVAVTEEIIWMYLLYPTFVVKGIYAYNYVKSEWVRALHPSSISPFPTLSTSDKYISWFFDRKFIVYSLKGAKAVSSGSRRNR